MPLVHASAPENELHHKAWAATDASVRKQLWGLGLQLFRGDVAHLANTVKTATPIRTIVRGTERSVARASMLMTQSELDNALFRLRFDGEANYKREVAANITRADEGTFEGLFEYGVPSRSGLQTHGKVVVDVGANLGDFTIAIAKLYPDVQVLALEPSPTTHFFLLWNLLLNNITLLSPNDFGTRHIGGGVLPMQRVAGRNSLRFYWSDEASVSGTARPVEDTKAPSGGFTSQHWSFLTPWKGAHENAATWSSTIVDGLDVPSFLMSKGFESMQILKIDCETCEYDVLPRWSAEGWLTKRRVSRLVGELHERYYTKSRFPITSEQVQALEDALRQRGGCLRPPFAECRQMMRCN